MNVTSYVAHSAVWSCPARCLHATFVGTRKQRLKGLRMLAKNEDLLSQIEKEVKDTQDESTSGRGFGAQQQKTKRKPTQRERPFTVELPQAKEPTPAETLEGNTIRVLAAIFVVFLFEGLLLATAGFLPPAADDFVTKYIYPAFSPTLGVFLAISVVYGLVKSRQGKQ